MQGKALKPKNIYFFIFIALSGVKTFTIKCYGRKANQLTFRREVIDLTFPDFFFLGHLTQHQFVEFGYQIDQVV